MALNWLFEISDKQVIGEGTPTVHYRLSMFPQTYNTNSYIGQVVPDSFEGITINRVKVELSQITRSEITIEVIGTYTKANVVGKRLIIREVDGTDVTDMIGAWQYSIESMSYAYGKTRIVAVDLLTSVIDGVWPVTAAIRDLFPESVFKYGGLDDTACLPKVFGEHSYIPIQSKSSAGDVHYILGLGTGSTYTITEITSPHNIDNPISYTVDTDIWVEQTTDSTYEFFQPFMESGLVSPVFWKSGAERVPPHVQFYGSSFFSGMTNPVDILSYVIEECGIASVDIDATWGTVATSVAARGYTFSRGYYQPEDRAKLICNLLAACDCNIYPYSQRLSIAINSKTPVATIDSSKVLKPSVLEHGDLSWDAMLPSKYDSGYVTWFVHGEPQVRLMRAKVTASTTTLNPSNDVLDLSGVSDSQSAQKLGTLHFLRAYYRNGECTFTGPPELAALLPGQIVTIDDALYGPTTDAMVEAIRINRDTTVRLTLSTYAVPFVDFEDLSPAAITPVEDTATNPISTLSQAVESGPYIPVVYIPGVLTADQVLLYHVFSFQGASFPVDLDGSTAKAMDAATAETVVDIQKNGTSIGSITWAAAGTNGTFTFTTETAFVEGDTLSLIAPATADTTLGYVSVSLRGTKI